MIADASALGALLSTHPVAALAAVYAGGVLTSLTPCLYPMIPVTVSIVGGNAGERSALTRLSLALTYVVGLAGAYSALGLLAGLTGTLFGAVSTNPWLLFAMANVMLLAAMMMADVLPVPIPQAARDRAANLGEGGRYAGVLVMGIASGLVAAPCGAPVMAAILTWVSATGSAWLGFLYLFAFSLGMSSLLLGFALVADTSLRLPRAGRWMLWVKRAFAVILLGVAEYYLISMGQVLL
jgi:thiol:disulfide interchange protein DsbD